MDAANCIFCKIVSGQIPALKILETPACIAFLDINPLAPGHTLVIPRRHSADILEIPVDDLCAVAKELPRLSKVVMQATKATGLNILQNTGESSGQAVFHLHFHLIPRCERDGLGYRWNAGAYGPGQAEALRDQFLKVLQS